MINFTDFSDIAKTATQHTTSFIVDDVKIKALKALKFLIEDKQRMDELKRHGDSNHAVLHKYVQLYTITSAAEKDNVEFVVGPKLYTLDWYTFANGTEECLVPIIGNVGVPLSCMIRDDILRPALDPATATRAA